VEVASGGDGEGLGIKWVWVKVEVGGVGRCSSDAGSCEWFEGVGFKEDLWV